MVNACVLIRVAHGKGATALKGVKATEGVNEAFYTFGRYDIVAFATFKNAADALKLAGKINAVGGVRSTETLVEV